MKLTVTIEGLSSLARFDPERLVTRLRSEIERELQATAAASDRPLDAATHRAALDRVLRSLSPLASMRSMASP